MPDSFVRRRRRKIAFDTLGEGVCRVAGNIVVVDDDEGKKRREEAREKREEEEKCAHTTEER